MSSDFTAPLRSSLFDANTYTIEIHDVFDQHWEILNKDRREIIDKIDKWHHDWKKHISKYANEQKILINDHYNRLRPIFEDKYRKNLDMANTYYVAQQVDLFNDLREACRLLEFQIATLIYSKKEIDHPEVIILEEQLERKQLDEINMNTRDVARRRRRLKQENNNKVEDTNDASASSSSNSVTSNSKQTDGRQSSEIKSKRKNDQSTDNTDASKNQAMHDDQSNNKCPICFMIFTLNMTRDNREKHVNEHYTDD